MSVRPLTAHALTKAYGHDVVLDGTDLLVSPGQRVGIVGENGVGKSTLLRLLAGVETPDHGTVARPQDLAYLPQESSFSATDTVADVLTDALAPLHHAVREVERLGSAMATAPEDRRLAGLLADALEWAQSHDAWDADRRAAIAAQRLGVADLAGERQVATLSGGQRTRLAIAAILTRRPECVLLDEPTNHLDDAAMDLLETFLLALPGVVVAASHDRAFLDAVCTHVVDLDPAMGAHRSTPPGPTRYGGGFSDYLADKADARRRWEETYTAQQARIGALRAATTITTSAVAHNRPPRDNDKFSYGFKGANVERTVARRVHDAERRLAVAEREQVRRPRAPLRLRALLTGRTGGGALAVSIRALCVPGRVRLAELDLPTGGRLLVTGGNGSGKSSLLALLDGRLRAGSGSVHVTARRVATLVQDVTFAVPTRSARETFAVALGYAEAERHPLSDLGLMHGRDLDRAVGDLSVGQRRRVALAIAVAQAPDLLLLDEPTNHISLALATELEEAILAPAGSTGPASHSGTVVVATHDRWLRRRWSGQQLRLTASPL